MRTFKIALTGWLVLAWGAGLLSAEPLPSVNIHVSLALPAQAIDFGDLDFRDENNRPIAAPQARHRFEDLLQRNLNQLLIESLTPMRRAWLNLLSAEKDVFGDWIGRAADNARRIFSTAANGGARLAVIMRAVSMPRASKATAGAQPAGDKFLSLAFLLISTTRLIC